MSAFHSVRRRLCLAAAALLLPWPLPGAAQRMQVRTIGWLGPAPAVDGTTRRQFVDRARELGWVVGRNLAIEYREMADGQDGRAEAAELVRLEVELIVAQAPSALLAARSATRTIPIVAFFIGDPVRMGVTRSLARPDGNVTGFTWDAGLETMGKALEVLHAIAPRANKIALLWNLDNESHPGYVNAFERDAKGLGLTIHAVGVRRADELEGAFDEMTRAGAGAVIVFTDPFMIRRRAMLTALLARHPLAAMWSSEAWPLDGAVVTFGADVSGDPRRAAEYVDKILRGTPLASLPFQQPTRDRLTIDARVARRLGLTLSPSLQARADRIVAE